MGCVVQTKLMSGWAYHAFPHIKRTVLHWRLMNLVLDVKVVLSLLSVWVFGAVCNHLFALLHLLGRQRCLGGLIVDSGACLRDCVVVNQSLVVWHLGGLLVFPSYLLSVWLSRVLFQRNIQHLFILALLGFGLKVLMLHDCCNLLLRRLQELVNLGLSLVLNRVVSFVLLRSSWTGSWGGNLNTGLRRAGSLAWSSDLVFLHFHVVALDVFEFN